MAYRILVVEDEVDTRELLTLTLGFDGHRVETVENAREALELLAGRSYDVILTNLRMPGMSGEELYQRIEQGWPRTHRCASCLARRRIGCVAPGLPKTALESHET